MVFLPHRTSFNEEMRPRQLRGIMSNLESDALTLVSQVPHPESDQPVYPTLCTIIL